MSQAPFMQFYVSDYLADTLALSAEQHGAYLLLLCAMWRAGGRLEQKPATLAKICRMSARRFARISPDIMAMMTVFEEGGRQYITQKRLKQELKAAAEKSEQRRMAGQAGAAGRYGHGTANAQQTHSKRIANAQQTHGNPMPYQNQNIDTSLCSVSQKKRTKKSFGENETEYSASLRSAEMGAEAQALPVHGKNWDETTRQPAAPPAMAAEAAPDGQTAERLPDAPQGPAIDATGRWVAPKGGVNSRPHEPEAAAEEVSKGNAVPAPANQPELPGSCAAPPPAPGGVKADALLAAEAARATRMAAAKAQAKAVAAEFAREFWPAYPHKTGKPVAEKAFAKARQKADLAAILAGLTRYKSAKPPDRQWLNPATFLNQERWADEPAPTEAERGKNGKNSGFGGAAQRQISGIGEALERSFCRFEGGRGAAMHGGGGEGGGLPSGGGAGGLCLITQS